MLGSAVPPWRTMVFGGVHGAGAVVAAEFCVGALPAVGESAGGALGAFEASDVAGVGVTGQPDEATFFLRWGRFTLAGFCCAAVCSEGFVCAEGLASAGGVGSCCACLSGAPAETGADWDSAAQGAAVAKIPKKRIAARVIPGPEWCKTAQS